MRRVLSNVCRLRTGAAVQDQHPLPGLPPPTRRDPGQAALPAMRPRRVHPCGNRMVRAVFQPGRDPEGASTVRAVRSDGPSAQQRAVWPLLATTP